MKDQIKVQDIVAGLLVAFDRTHLPRPKSIIIEFTYEQMREFKHRINPIGFDFTREGDLISGPNPLIRFKEID